MKFWNLLPVDMECKKELEVEISRFQQPLQADDIHLAETLQWICRAQDYTPDCGVSRSFKAARYNGYGLHGWQPSYPETTGYIIPTMISGGKVLHDSSLIDRAMKMADWEMAIQMESGAVMGSVVTAPITPAVFNTGQVIFGWLAAYRENHKTKYLDAAIRAGNYLIKIQDETGTWSIGDSKYAKKGATLYNTRVAWALTELGKITGKEEFIFSASRFIDYALSKQQKNGWFPENCLNDPSYPLLHTVVYATRGVLEAGILLQNERYIESAKKVLDALLLCQREDGGIPGRLDKDWRSKEKWDCLTGDAQAVVSWLRYCSIKENKKYRNAARKTVEFIKRSQNLEHLNPGIRGGVKGSFPFDGSYGQFEILNWAAKFFIDSLIFINYSKLLNTGIRG